MKQSILEKLAATQRVTKFLVFMQPEGSLTCSYDPTIAPYREPHESTLHRHTPFLYDPWSGVLLEKPPVAQLFNNLPTFYGTPRFIIVFERALHRSLSFL
jgi:hypothetical protein